MIKNNELRISICVFELNHGKVDRELLRSKKIINVSKRCRDAILLRISLLSAENV